MEKRTYLIVGAGPAGVEAATAIRKQDPDGAIRIVTDERHPYYSRLRIGEVVDGRAKPETLILRPENWYEEQRIKLELGRRIDGIDIENRRAFYDGGGSTPWDRLLLATGGRPFIPPIPGLEGPGVWSLRTLDSALALSKNIKPGMDVVVLGGGLLGLEGAASLAMAGCKVKVMERADWLLPRELDRVGGNAVQTILEERDISFGLSDSVVEVERRDDGRFLLETESGDGLEADLVLVCAGIRPALTLANSIGIKTGRGIVVDDRLNTSEQDIWSAGDCTEHRDRMYGIWTAATEQGRMAGFSMAGGDAEYSGTRRQTSLKVAGIAVTSLGDFDTMDGEVEAHSSARAYRKLVRDDDGRITGAILVGEHADRRDILAAFVQGKAYRNGTN